MSGANLELVVVGRICVEYLAHARWLPEAGETVEATCFEQALGGRGARHAVAATRMGAHVRLVAPVGPDARAECLLGWLAAEKVDTTHVRRDETVATGAALIQVDVRSTRQAMVFPAAPHAVSQLDVEGAAGAIQAAHGLVVSLELPPSVVDRATWLAREAGKRVVLDAAGVRTPCADILRRADVVHVTPRETALLVGIEVLGPATARAAGEALAARGPKAVVLELGTDGHLLVGERDLEVFPRLGCPPADESVCSEAFASAFAVGLAEGRSLREAGIFASAARALVSAEYGVRAFPKRDAVLRLLEATTGKSWEIDVAA